MAAEASRSSGSVDSYIGSLISLTSKSEIRYEGVLFTINTREASIGLRNVQSFGTEGRKKDGPQIPASDRVYEYIVFRGSDIKDLQVKSSPPVQTASIHDDPAIIQSDRGQAPSTTSLPTANSAAVSAVGAQMSQNGLARSPFQTNPPLYQPGGNMSWGSAAPSSASLSGPIMPMYQQQEFYGSSSSLQSQQPSLLQPPQGLPMTYPVQQPINNSVLNATLSTAMPASQTFDFQPMLLQPPVSGGSSALPGTILGHSTAVTSDTSTSLLPTKPPAQAPLSMSQNVGLPLVPPVSNTLTRGVSNTVTNQTKRVPSPMTSYGGGMPEPVSAAVGTSNAPSLVTPGHFAQPGLAPFSAAQPPQTTRKDVEVVHVSSSVQLPPLGLPASVSSAAAVPTSTESAPLLPLPTPAVPEFDRAPLRSHYTHRGGGRGRGRGSELSNAETKFTEEFDFEAMNEKFNKDEVWGQLGRNKANEEEDFGYDNHNDQFPPVEPVYNKDDFFDTLSSNSIGNGSRGGYGRPRFSEQRRLDTETFGEYSRYRGGRGWRGRFNRGGHYGRGYGYDGRGRGHQNVYRV